MEGKGPEPFPDFLIDMLYQINQTKWNLVRSKQEQQNKSYAEICAPIIDRCRFLLQELRCIDAPEVLAFKRQAFLPPSSRWHKAVRKVVRDIRLAKNATQRSSRPEDIFNSTIQSKNSNTSQTLGGVPASSIRISGDNSSSILGNVMELCNTSTGDNLDSNSFDSLSQNHPVDEEKAELSESHLDKDKDADVGCQKPNEEQIVGDPATVQMTHSTLSNSEPAQQSIIVEEISKKFESGKSMKKVGKAKKRLLVPDAADFKPRFSNILTFVTGLNHCPNVETVRRAMMRQVITRSSN